MGRVEVLARWFPPENVYDSSLDAGRSRLQAQRTAAEHMVVHLAGIAFDVVMFRGSFDDVEVFAWDDDVGGVGATGPFLAIGAVAEGCGHGFAGILVLDGRAHAGAFCHCGDEGGIS